MNKNRKAAMQRAAEAHSNISAFQAVVALLEGGLVYGGGKSSRVAARIIKVCQAQCQHELQNFDREMAYVAKD